MSDHLVLPLKTFTALTSGAALYRAVVRSIQFMHRVYICMGAIGSYYHVIHL